MAHPPINEAEYEKHFVDVDGIRTCYIEAGEGDPLILIHGGGAGANSYGNWFTCIPLFAKHFRTIAVDMVGFGDTDKPDPATYEYSQQNRNRHIAGFIQALGYDRASLVGNSMGGATAIGVAVERPELVDKLVLMGSAGLNTEITEALEPVIKYDFTPEGMRRLIDALTNATFEITEEMVRYRHASSVREDTIPALKAIMGWVKEAGGLFYPDEFIAQVTQPTLVVNGKDDIIVPLENAYRFLELIENSWGYIMPKTGHWAMIERPEDFTSAVTTFVLNH